MQEEMATKQLNRKLRVCLVIVGGILVHLCLGSFYIFGNISPYMISYLRNRTDEHTLRNEDNLWIMNGASIVMPFAITIGGVLDRHLGVRVATSIGCLLFCSGVALTYFTIKKSLVFVAMAYGMLTNFGAFIAYGPPTQAAVQWLPKRPTFAVGLIVCGFGGGALIFNQVATALINPSNISPDLHTSDGEKYFTSKTVLDQVPTVFLWLAGIYLCLQLLGIVLITSPSKEYKELSEYNERPETEVDKEGQYSSPEEKQALLDNSYHLQGTKAQETKVPVKDVLRKLLTNKNAWIWWFILFLCYGGMTFANSLYKAYGQTFISDDRFLALVGSLSSVFNCTLRPVWGLIMDRYGFQTTVKVATAGVVCFWCTIMLTESMGKVAFLVWLCMLYASSCFIWAVGPATLAKLFGAENLAINMGFLFVAVAAAAITVGFVGLNLQTVLGWHGLFLLAGVMGAIAFFLTFFFDGKDMAGNPI